ncbi:chaperone NapD [Novispirillum sp. DQ9]|uniref:chaperone NapD n=1 Tax=Novispirillum sp. DQ9 TaxID=3398612 RepID=UPI003C7C4DE7
MRTTRFDRPSGPEHLPLPPTGGPVNICGVLLHATPDKTAAVVARLSGTAGCEVHASSPDGRIVVVVEDTDEVLAIDRLKGFTDWDGVAASALVFHQFEDATALEGEIEAC